MRAIYDSFTNSLQWHSVPTMIVGNGIPKQLDKPCVDEVVQFNNLPVSFVNNLLKQINLCNYL